MRVCTDCPALIPTGTRCPTCTRTRDRERGSREERGYDTAHRTLRRAWRNRQDAGDTLTCWRCQQPITGTDWHLGHDPDHPTQHAGPEHVSCNTNTAHQRGQYLTVRVPEA